MHPFRFGVMASWADSTAAWTALARRAEELGYAILLVPDHMGRQLSPIPALAAAMATTQLRIGSYVFAHAGAIAYLEAAVVVRPLTNGLCPPSAPGRRSGFGEPGLV
jgi:hypothetical protein